MKTLTKTIVSGLLACVCLFSLFAFTACSGGTLDYTDGLTPSQGLEFEHISDNGKTFSLSYASEIDDDDYYVLTGIGSCADAVVVVPSEYDGKPVKAVADECFEGLSTMEGLILPNSVEVTGTMAIKKCTGVKQFKANGIRVYGDGAQGALEIKDIVLSQVAERLEQWAFFMGSEYDTIWIPKTLRSMGVSVFMNSAFTKIYYEGSEEDWAKVEFDAGEQDFDIPIEYNVPFPGND